MCTDTDTHTYTPHPKRNEIIQQELNTAWNVNFSGRFRVIKNKINFYVKTNMNNLE